MRIMLAAAAILSFTGSASAACQCQCVNGTMEALCSSSFDPRPFCSGFCPFSAPATSSQRTFDTPPFGASSCSLRQVWNGYAYETRSVCQ